MDVKTVDISINMLPQRTDFALLPDKNGGRWQQFFAAFSVSYVCISAGNFLGYTSTAIPSMGNDSQFSNLTHHDISWIGSLSPLGAMCGSILATLPIGQWGAKNTVMTCASPLLIGSWLTIAFSKNIYYIFVGRFLGGLGSGVAISSAPLYIIEVASDCQRGRLGILPQFLMIFGIWLSTVLGSVLEWRNLAVASVLITSPSVLLLLLAPNTPSYFILRKEYSKALESYKRLRGIPLNTTAGSDCIIKETQVSKMLEKNLITNRLEEPSEFQTIVDQIHENKKNNNLIQRGYFQKIEPSTVKACAVALALMSFQQLTGINGVTFYAVMIFKETPGFHQLGPYLPAIILTAIQCLAVLISTCFVEKLGRKFLLLTSASLLSLAAGILSLYYYSCSSNPNSYLTGSEVCEVLRWVPLAFLTCFVFAFAIGYGPLCWIVVTEILPLHVRYVMNPLTIGYSWFCVFLVTKSFPILMVEITLSGIFILFGVIGLVSILFIFFLVPETKGKSLEEIQTFFRRQD